jgi:hypothetical protein
MNRKTRNPVIYSQLIFEKGTKNIHLGKDSLLNNDILPHYAQTETIQT